MSSFAGTHSSCGSSVLSLQHVNIGPVVAYWSRIFFPVLDWLHTGIYSILKGNVRVKCGSLQILNMIPFVGEAHTQESRTLMNVLVPCIFRTMAQYVHYSKHLRSNKLRTYCVENNESLVSSSITSAG